MALTWGQLKAYATANAVPDTAPMFLTVEVPETGGTPSVTLPGFTVAPGQTVTLQKSLDAVVVKSGTLYGS